MNPIPSASSSRFDGGQIMSALVTVKGADELERALATEAGGTVMLDSSDGRYTVVARPASST